MQALRTNRLCVTSRQQSWHRAVRWVLLSMTGCTTLQGRDSWRLHQHPQVAPQAVVRRMMLLQGRQVDRSSCHCMAQCVVRAILRRMKTMHRWAITLCLSVEICDFLIGCCGSSSLSFPS